MSLIKPKARVELTPVKFNLEKRVHTQMQAYCHWASIQKIDDFIEQAILFVFSKDKAWKQFNANRETDRES